MLPLHLVKLLLPDRDLRSLGLGERPEVRDRLQLRLLLLAQLRLELLQHLIEDSVDRARPGGVRLVVCIDGCLHEAAGPSPGAARSPRDDTPGQVLRQAADAGAARVERTEQRVLEFLVGGLCGVGPGPEGGLEQLRPFALAVAAGRVSPQQLIPQSRTAEQDPQRGDQRSLQLHKGATVMLREHRDRIPQVVNPLHKVLLLAAELTGLLLADGRCRLQRLRVLGDLVLELADLRAEDAPAGAAALHLSTQLHVLRLRILDGLRLLLLVGVAPAGHLVEHPGLLLRLRLQLGLHRAQQLHDAPDGALALLRRARLQRPLRAPQACSSEAAAACEGAMRGMEAAREEAEHQALHCSRVGPAGA
mmetsp:Transcript_31946/g.91653  ORF Transcript_31946/g.91653 Transcript_31946/m.91653 type:complete len:362 (-) Transcript_31946:45-1130(-)